MVVFRVNNKSKTLINLAAPDRLGDLIGGMPEMWTLLNGTTSCPSIQTFIAGSIGIDEHAHSLLLILRVAADVARLALLEATGK